MGVDRIVRHRVPRVATSLVVAITLMSTLLVVGVERVASATGQTITEAATFPVDDEALGLTSLTVVPQQIGDLLVFQSQIHSQSITVTSVDCPDTGAWHLAERYVDSVNGIITEEIWWAVVTGTGSTSITATYSSSVAALNPQLVADSFSSSVPANWSLVTGGGTASTGTTSFTYPNLTSGSGGANLYWGYAESTQTASSGTGTTGFVYTQVANGNLVASNVGLAAATAYEPSAVQSPAADDTAVGAIFEADPTYTVTYDGNGATSGTMAPEVESTPTALTTNAFSRTNYTFTGWNTAANGTGTAYADLATYPFTADATLYAQWVADNHTVTYDGNGATSGSMAPQVANQSTSLSNLAFTRVNYSFAGWNTAANGTGTAYANLATYPFTADATLYAQWVAVDHTVTFVGNGATGGSMTPEVTNAATALTANTFSRTNYTFAGWNSVANGTGTTYADRSMYPFTADATLYAQWAADNHTVTFVGNGANHGAMAHETANQPTRLYANTFSRTNYAFTGWNTRPNGTGTKYANVAAYSFVANVTLYAQWKAILHATRVVGYAVVGQTRTVTIVGLGFTTATRISTSDRHSTIRIVRRSANRLVVSVKASKSAMIGRHTFTITSPSQRGAKITYLTK